MTLLSIMSRMFVNPQTPAATQTERTKTPLDMHQGSVVVIPEVDLALAQVDGSFVKSLQGDQIVTAVGRYRFLNHEIYHAYLNKGTEFVQLVCDDHDKLQEARLFTHYAELSPASQEEWEFWLGSYVRDDQGLVRNSAGKPILKEAGLIGWHQFQIDGPPATVYDRAWVSGTHGVEPFQYTETIVSQTGLRTQVRHEVMEYFRKIGDTTESLLASVCQLDDEASVNIWTGVPLDINNIKVLSS